MKKVKLKKANQGMTVKPASSKLVVKKPVEKSTNIYGKNPATGKEEQMVMKSGKYAFATKKKGGALSKAMYGKSIMQKGGTPADQTSVKPKVVSTIKGSTAAKPKSKSSGMSFKYGGVKSKKK